MKLRVLKLNSQSQANNQDLYNTQRGKTGMGLQNEFKYIKNGDSLSDKNIVHKYYWIFLEATGIWYVMSVHVLLD